MMDNLEKEFPDIISTRSIGNTWEGRPMRIIEMDARKLMESKGIAEEVVTGKPIS